MSEPVFLTEANVTAEVFQTLMYGCEVASWLAQGPGWTGMKSYDVAVKISDFLNGPGIENVTLAAPQLAEYVGASVERTQFLFDFMNDMVGFPFPDQVEAIKQVIPYAGHPTNDSDTFTGVFVMFTVLMFAFLGLRFYSRYAITGFVRGYDWVLILAALVTFGFGLMNAVCLSGPTHFQGLWDRSWDNYVVDKYSGKATEVLYPVGIFLVKLSLLWFYWGLSTYWPLRVAAAVTAVVALGNSLAMIFIWVFRCSPVLAFADESYFTSECKFKLWLDSQDVTGAINIVTDVVIWIIPLPMVWKITQGLRERLLAVVTFGIGALACIACGFRFSSTRQLQEPSLLPPDQSRWLIWGMAEMYIAIICSCVPAIRALLIKKAPSIIGSTGIYEPTYGKSSSGKSEKGVVDEKNPAKIVESGDIDSHRGGSPA